MNDHEASRIAAAMHSARPDWPTASVLTLIRKNLIDRPRRDVFVALAWVASEPNTSTPARVLEAGPWWRAAGIEGGRTKREEPTPDDRCSVCSLASAACQARWSGDHVFTPSHRRPEVHNTAEIVKRMKAEAACHVRPTDPEKVPVPPDPNVDRLRAAMTQPSARQCHPECTLGPDADHPGYLEYRCIDDAVNALPFPGEENPKSAAEPDPTPTRDPDPVAAESVPVEEDV